ncbi:MAG: dTMP kinase [Chloroflexi bacterium]|nr:dTMP kinase [Chloroflexota bacterium]
MPLFLSFEGGEGSGKSTQAKKLYQRLIGQGYTALLVREPGTTPLGNYLRDWLKSQKRQEDAISPVAEMFLFEAARAELVAKVIRPYLSATPHGIVITDRYMDSTAAYQGYGRRIDLEKVTAANDLAVQGVVPDLTFLLDIPPEEGLNRVRAKVGLEEAGTGQVGRMDAEGTRRFEEESLAFHRRVRQGYLKLVKQSPERWRVVDAARSVHDIAEEIWTLLEKHLANLSIQHNDEQAGLFSRLKPN